MKPATTAFYAFWAIALASFVAIVVFAWID